VKPKHGSTGVHKAVVYSSKRQFVGTDRFAYQVCARPKRLGCGLAEVLVTVSPG
jgi:hypothetical protein